MAGMDEVKKQRVSSSLNNEILQRITRTETIVDNIEKKIDSYNGLRGKIDTVIANENACKMAVQSRLDENAADIAACNKNVENVIKAVETIQSTNKKIFWLAVSGLITSTFAIITAMVIAFLRFKLQI